MIDTLFPPSNRVNFWHSNLFLEIHILPASDRNFSKPHNDGHKDNSNWNSSSSSGSRSGSKNKTLNWKDATLQPLDRIDIIREYSVFLCDELRVEGKL